MFTGNQLANYCLRVFAAKWVYWYGTYGRKCTRKLYDSKRRQYPSHYGDSRTAGYMKDINEGRTCADCVGMIKSFFWKNGDMDAEPKYATNHCPDVSANGMIKLCAQTGPISTIPEEPGLVVWKDGHIGVYVGGGYTVEMKGFNYDCLKKKVTSGPWKKWGRLPASMISYTNELTPAPEPEPVGDRDLRNGCEGEDVKELQEALMKLGWSFPKYGADGEFGSETEGNVKGFQRLNGLTVDGVMKKDDYTMLFKELGLYKQVLITGGSVNIRSAPGYDTKILGVAHKGDLLPYQGETRQAEGKDWYLVIFKNQNAWVSSKYAEVVA